MAKQRSVIIKKLGKVPLPDGIFVDWSPVNQAWLVRWHETPLRVISDPQELHDYLTVELGQVRAAAKSARTNPGTTSMRYGLPEEGRFGNEFTEEFAAGAAQAYWADAIFSLGADKRTAELAGSTTPPLSAWVKAGQLIGALQTLNGVHIAVLGARAARADTGDYDVNLTDAREFGYALALESLGHGVSWFDNHKSFKLNVPNLEYNPDLEGLL